MPHICPRYLKTKPHETESLDAHPNEHPLICWIYRRDSAVPAATKSPRKETHPRKKAEKNKRRMGARSMKQSECSDA
jgi:hypothetical protein